MTRSTLPSILHPTARVCDDLQGVDLQGVMLATLNPHGHQATHKSRIPKLPKLPKLPNLSAPKPSMRWSASGASQSRPGQRRLRFSGFTGSLRVFPGLRVYGFRLCAFFLFFPLQSKRRCSLDMVKRTRDKLTHVVSASWHQASALVCVHQDVVSPVLA